MLDDITKQRLLYNVIKYPLRHNAFSSFVEAFRFAQVEQVAYSPLTLHRYSRKKLALAGIFTTTSNLSYSRRHIYVYSLAQHPSILDPHLIKSRVGHEITEIAISLDKSSTYLALVPASRARAFSSFVYIRTNAGFLSTSIIETYKQF